MDFEEDFDNWAARGDVTVAHTDEYSKSGKYSIYSTNRTQTWNAPTVHITDKIIKGESYYYSAKDNYGHEAGDEAIIRIGGDEFVCISKSDFKEVLLAEIKKESAIDKKYPYEIA